MVFYHFTLNCIENLKKRKKKSVRCTACALLVSIINVLFDEQYIKACSMVYHTYINIYLYIYTTMTTYILNSECTSSILCNVCARVSFFSFFSPHFVSSPQHICVLLCNMLSMYTNEYKYTCMCVCVCVMKVYYYYSALFFGSEIFNRVTYVYIEYTYTCLETAHYWTVKQKIHFDFG